MASNDTQNGLVVPTGCVLLDLEGDTFPEVVDQLVSHLVGSGSLPVTCAEQVRMLLQKKHKHSSSDRTLWEKIKNSATGE